MHCQLAQGHFWGAVLRRRETGGVILTETRYRPGTRIPLHSHETAYVCYVRSGGYSETYDDRIRTCGARTVVFHPVGEVHAEVFGDREVRSFNIELTHRFVAAHPECEPLLEQQAAFRGEPLSGLARRLHNAFRDSDAGAPLAAESALAELLAQAVKQLRGLAPAGVPHWLERARAILHGRYLERVSLESVAREVGVHPVYLATAFRKHYGSSVGEYVRRLRVEFAARELGRPQSALADVAALAGFADQAHFTRVFKALMGLTPGEYRAQRSA